MFLLFSEWFFLFGIVLRCGACKLQYKWLLGCPGIAPWPGVGRPEHGQFLEGWHGGWDSCFFFRNPLIATNASIQASYCSLIHTSSIPHSTSIHPSSIHPCIPHPYAWRIHEICSFCDESAWNVYGMWMEHAWNMHGICMEHAWNMYRICIEYA